VRAQPSRTQQLQLQLPNELTDARVRAHVIAPAALRSVQTEEQVRTARLAIPAIARQFSTTPSLDVGAFGLALHNVLRNSVAGYVLQIARNGVPIHLGIWNWAQTPADAGQGWTENTRMHLASVSKLLTAVGVTKALGGLSYDTKIINYLPTYWSKGPNIDKITFRHLLTHRSGFTTGGSGSDYALMKSKVAAGVSNVGASSGYENMNFGLMRILIPILRGTVNKSASFGAYNDATWDLLTVYYYKKYMQDNVFTPAGVSNADFAPRPGAKAFAYRFPVGNTPGWNSGDLSTVAGGAGWRLSTRELLSVMNHVRRRNTIISAAAAQNMLDNRFGLNGAPSTPAGEVYYKKGLWRDGAGKTEQCGAYFLPGGMELAVFVNSQIGAAGYDLWQIVLDTYKNSLA
jgi:CubicO group peptidase (beta-lactamase class C family)